MPWVCKIKRAVDIAGYCGALDIDIHYIIYCHWFAFGILSRGLLRIARLESIDS